MAITHIKGTAINTCGDLPKVGDKAPAVTLVAGDLSTIALDQFAGKRLILNIFPSIDTGVCQASVRHFNEDAAKLDNAAVLCVSRDLPFAMGRFCGAEGIENVSVGSDFRHTFGEQFGVTMVEGPLAGLLARSVVVLDADGAVTYSELVDELTSEPNYEAALASLI